MAKLHVSQAGVNDISKSSFRNYLNSLISVLQILPFHSTSDFKIYFFQKKNYCKKNNVFFFLNNFFFEKSKLYNPTLNGRVGSEERISMNLNNS